MKNFIVAIIAQLITLSILAQAWTDLSDIPEKLAFPVVVVLNNNIHVIGGGAPVGATGLHLRYKIGVDTWDTLTPVPFLAQQPGGAVVNGKIHYFGGGFPNSGTPLNDHYVYDPGSNSWDTASIIPINRVIHEAVTLKDSIYVMGGQPDKLRFELYSTSTNSWKSLNNLPDQDFWYGSIVTVNDTIYRFGGGGFLSPSKKAQRYNVSTDSWNNLPDMPEELHALAGAAIGDSIYLVGGYNTGNVKDKVWIYDIKTQIYHQGFPVPKARNYHAVVSVGSCIYSLGGNDVDVERSVIRHCLGDTADYTRIKQQTPQENTFDISYTAGIINFKVPIQSDDRLTKIELYDVSGRQVLSQINEVNANGYGELDLSQSYIHSKTAFFIVKIYYHGRSQSKKILSN